MFDFSGSYFMSNLEDVGRRYREGDWEKFAFLACDMQNPSNDLFYFDPASFQLSTIKTILMGKKFVFDGNHFFPIKRKSNNIYNNAIECCVRKLVERITDFISRGNVPKLSKVIMEVDSEIQSNFFDEVMRNLCDEEVSLKKYREDLREHEENLRKYQHTNLTEMPNLRVVLLAKEDTLKQYTEHLLAKDETLKQYTEYLRTKEDTFNRAQLKLAHKDDVIAARDVEIKKLRDELINIQLDQLLEKTTAVPLSSCR